MVALHIGERAISGYILHIPSQQWGPELKKASKVLEDANYDMSTVYFFDNEKESYETIDNLLSPGDVMLLKGSHSMNLINIVNRLRGE